MQAALMLSEDQNMLSVSWYYATFHCYCIVCGAVGKQDVDKHLFVLAIVQGVARCGHRGLGRAVWDFTALGRSFTKPLIFISLFIYSMD